MDPAEQRSDAMERDDYVRRARRVFLAPRELEEEPTFRTALAQLACTGLQWGGGLGIVAVVILVLVNVLLLGRPTTWWYPAAVTPEAFVLWDKVVAVLLCGAAVGIGRTHCRLSTGRVVGFVLAVAITVVALIHDAYRGILSIEYVILIYLLAVAALPYRPWQALLLGGAITLTLAGLGHYGLPGTVAAAPRLVTADGLVRMTFVTVVVTGIAALLYSVRYHQHRERRTAERLHEQVAALERAKSHFFADVSHEFRTPLTLIHGSLQEALDGRFGALPDPLRDRMETMDAQAQRMRRLVNQLLELAQLDEGHMVLSMHQHELTALVQQIALPFRDWAETEGLNVQIDMKEDRLDAWVDVDRLEDALANLLSNAIRYTPEGGTIRIRVDRGDGEGRIAVRDTGPGLPDPVRKRVFGRFESRIPVAEAVDRGAAASPEVDSWIGMGIGLAHTKALVERHDGRLEIESEAGFGTECTIVLPLGRDHVSEEDVAEGEVAGERTVDVDRWRAGVRPPSEATPFPDRSGSEEAPEVLVVDDEVEMRAYLRNLLGSRYRVATAASVDDALERLHEDRPDLVLSDVVMPGRDGIDLCRTIREDEPLRHLPVILLTTQHDANARLVGLKAGADAYVSKPFDPVELEARVENLIEIRRIVQDRVRIPDWMEPKETAVSSEEAEFLEALNEVVDAHIDNSNFGVDWLADEMDLSTRHLRRRLKEVTRLSPAGFIRTRRLQHAASLLQKGMDTISDVAEAVGYRDASYFSRLFRETFGCSPTEYAEMDLDPPEKPDTEP